MEIFELAAELGKPTAGVNLGTLGFLTALERTEIEGLSALGEGDFTTEDRIPYHYIKFIQDGIYEFRVNFGNNEFRIFFIYDGDTLVVLMNCFRKKTQKTPKSEIEKAVKLKKEYYETKGNR